MKFVEAHPTTILGVVPLTRSERVGGGHMADCTICSEPLAVPGASLTRCGHVFHTQCIEKWFDQKPLCPLCKTRSTGRSFTRMLRAPVPLDPDELERMRALASAEPAGADAALARLRAAMRQHEHDRGVCTEASDAERQVVAHKRAALHQKEAELLKLKRELAAARRVENAATAAVRADRSGSQDRARAGDENAPNGMPLAPPPLLDADKAVSVDAVKQQSQQLAWRCQELRECAHHHHHHCVTPRLLYQVCVVAPC